MALKCQIYVYKTKLIGITMPMIFFTFAFYEHIFEERKKKRTQLNLSNARSNIEFSQKQRKMHTAANN